MRGLWLLSRRHLAHRRLQTAILVFCIALSVFLPVTVHVLIDRYETDLMARGRATPLVAGAKGNRFDLTLAALYFRPAELDPIPWHEVETIGGDGGATAIPLHLRFTARGFPIVGTSPEYFELRGLRCATGDLPLRLGECTLGANVASRLELGPGDSISSEPLDLYDISKPPTLALAVRGVLAPTGGPDDDALFVDVKTCWVLDGLAHGHDDAGAVNDDMTLARADGLVDVNPALPSFQRITADNAASFHFHGERADLPLSAIIAVPRDDKASTILKTRTNASRTWQMVTPAAVVDDLLHFVFRIEAMLDVVAALLAITTALMLLLQLLLSMRLRAREMATLERIGCSRPTVAGLYAMEIVLIVLAGSALAAVASAVALCAVPDLVHAL